MQKSILLQWNQRHRDHQLRWYQFGSTHGALTSDTRVKGESLLRDDSLCSPHIINRLIFSGELESRVTHGLYNMGLLRLDITDCFFFWKLVVNYIMELILFSL